MDLEKTIGSIALGLAEHLVLYIVALVGAVGAGAMLGALMFGRRYKRRISALEAKQPTQINVNVSGAAVDYPPLPRAAPPEPLEEVKFNVAQHIPGEDILHVGTKYGRAAIRLNHKKTVEDILDVLSRNGVLQSLEEVNVK